MKAGRKSLSRIKTQMACAMEDRSQSDAETQWSKMETQEPSTSCHWLPGQRCAPGGCIPFQDRQVAVGRLATRSHGPAQASPSHKSPGTGSEERGTAWLSEHLVSWLFPAPIPTPAVLRGAFKAELGLQAPLGEAGRRKGFMASPPRECPLP